MELRGSYVGENFGELAEYGAERGEVGDPAIGDVGLYCGDCGDHCGDFCGVSIISSDRVMNIP